MSQLNIYQNDYHKKCMSAAKAVEKIASHSTLLVAMGAGAPPALLQAVATRVRNKELTDLKVYYKIATANVANTILADDVVPYIDAHSFFFTAADLQIVKKQQATKKKMVSFVP